MRTFILSLPAIFACSFISNVYAAPILVQPLSATPADGAVGFVPGAENFTPVGGDIAISSTLSLTWAGYYDTRMIPPPPSVFFDIAIFEDDGGAPALSPSSFGTIIGTTGPMVGAVGSVPVHEYSGAFGTAITLFAGTQYWISILEADTVAGAGPITDDEWFWAASTSGDDMVATFLPNGTPPPPEIWVVGDNNGVAPGGGLAVTIDAPLVTSVPEPTSIALLGMGALGFMGYGWRRRKHGSESSEV